LLNNNIATLDGYTLGHQYSFEIVATKAYQDMFKIAGEDTESYQGFALINGSAARFAQAAVQQVRQAKASPQWNQAYVDALADFETSKKALDNLKQVQVQSITYAPIVPDGLASGNSEKKQTEEQQQLEKDFELMRSVTQQDRLNRLAVVALIGSAIKEVNIKSEEISLSDPSSLKFNKYLIRSTEVQEA